MSVNHGEDCARTRPVLLKLGAVCYNAQVATVERRICVAASLAGAPMVVRNRAGLLKEMK